MKFSFFHRSDGKVLVVTLVIALLVALAVSALLVIAKNQSVLTARSQTWASEIPIAEAGIEEAMAHINSKPKSLATNGWQAIGTKFVKSRRLADGYFYTEISSGTTPRIVSIGYGRIPLQTNYTSRTIVATTKLGPPAWGIIARRDINLSGTDAAIDSFDSTEGPYQVSTRRDRAGVATLSTNNPAINGGTARIYGSAATGPGGTATGSIGDGEWLATSSGIQPGHLSDDFNMAIPDVVLPAELSSALPRPGDGVVGTTHYKLVLGNRDYFLTRCSINGDDMVVTGQARLYISGDIKLAGGGSITITPTGSLEVYVGGGVDLGGRGLFNYTATATKCAFFGLPTCTRFNYSGLAALTARVYAPNADIKMGGRSDFFGGMVGNTLDFGGTPGIHYDEALGAGDRDVRIASWEEM